MKTIKLITALLLTIFSSTILFAGNYSWTGTTNTDWATGTNWNPNGVPGSNDTVTITNQTNNPVLAANTTIKQMTMTSGTLSCNSFTLTVTATATFNGGTINSGTLTCSGTSTLTFAGTTFGAAVNATGNSILLNGSRFNSTFTGVKKGTANDNGNGGNYFSGAVTLTDSSSGNLVLSNSSASPDTFNSTLTVAARSSGIIYLAHQGTGNLFSGNVTFSSGNIYSNAYGTATYSGNITLNSTTGATVFGNNTGTCSIANGKTISIGTFSGGSLTIRNFTQSDNAVSLSIVLSGTATLAFGSGNSIQANLKAAGNSLKIEQSRFFGVDTFIHSGSVATSVGGNYFGGSTYIANNSTTSNLYIGGANVDTFATTATILATGSLPMNVRRGVFLGKVKFKSPNANASVSSLGCIFKDSLILESINGVIEIAAYGTYRALLDSAAKIGQVSGYKGKLTLKDVDQHGSNAMNINITTNTSGSGNNSILVLGPSAVFDGNFTYLGQRLQLNGATFNGTASFTRFNDQSDVCEGGNVFNGTTTIIDSVNTSNSDRTFKMANTNPDDFNADVTFKQYGAGSGASTVKLYPSYTKNSTFAGHVTVNANTIPVEFGANGGKIVFDGSGTQTLTKTGTYASTFKRIQINKSAGIVSLGYPVTLADTLFLTKGVITCDTSNYITVPDNGIVSGGSDSSYVHGPMKKVGNDAFSFALGDTSLHSGSYHPIEISSSASTSNAFIANYYPDSSGLAENLDSISVSTCEYWRLKNTSSTAKLLMGLGWNTNSCFTNDTTNAIVLASSTGDWVNYGKKYIVLSGPRGLIYSHDSIQFNSSSTVLLTNGSRIAADFTLSADTIDIGDTLTLVNTSSGFKSSQSFTWKLGQSCEGLDYDPYTNAGLEECTETTTGVASGLTWIYKYPGSYTIALSATYKGITYSKQRQVVVEDPGVSDMSSTMSCNTHPVNDLIYNGDFENFIYCMWGPIDGGRYPMVLSYLTLGNYVWGYSVCNWKSTNGCGTYPNYMPCVTPDYFLTNSCTPPAPHYASPAWVPDNMFGCENSYNGGHATMGFYAYKNDVTDGREYIRQELVSPLVACKVYKLRFYVALSEKCKYKVNGIGAGFSIGTTTTFGDLHPLSASNIVYSTSVYGSETWTLVELYYTATGGEDQIIIGNMLSDAACSIGTKTQHVCNANFQIITADGHYAYYFIDSVSLKRVTSLELAVSLTATPTCYGLQTGCVHATVTGGETPYTYSWSPNIGTTGNICGLDDGVYTLTVTDANGCTASSSVTVTESPELTVSITSHTDVTCNGFCDGSAVTSVSGGTPGYTYAWSPNGSVDDNPNDLCGGSNSVVVTDANGCTANTSVTIDEPDAISLSTSSTASCTDNNNNGSVTVSATGGTGSYTYSWDPAIGACSTCVTMTDLPAGSYTVTVTDANGCSEQAIETVDPSSDYPDPPVIEGDISDCYHSGGYNFTYLVSNYDNLGTYSILIHDAGGDHVGSINSSGEIFWTWPDETGGYITVTVGDVCTTSATFYVQSCCNAIPAASIPWFNTSFTALGISSPYSLPSPIVIAGNFIVDGNFIINDPGHYGIKFMPGSKIIIRPNYSLVFNQTTLERYVDAPVCDAMWAGIEIQKKAILQVNNTSILDAENAIIALDQSAYFLNGATFDRNFNCIKIPMQGSILVYSSVASFIQNTRFRGISPLANPYAGQLEWDVNPNAGIYAVSVSNLDISNNNSPDPNIHFDHLNYGIISVNSTTNISHSDFADILQTNATTYQGLPVAGVGVLAGSLSSFVSIDGAGIGSTFTNCNYGVFFQSSSGRIENCGMTGVNRGVYIGGNNLLQTVLVQHNPISANITAIECVHNSMSDIKIYSNQINMSGTSAHSGISVIEAPYIQRYSIDRGNSIQMNFAPLGIQLDNVRTSNISNNQIYLGSTNEMGIRAFGATTIMGNNITCNFIRSVSVGAGFGFANSRSIHVVSSSGNFIAGNTIDYTDNGISCALLNTFTRLLGNTINNHRFGVNLIGGLAARIGDQGSLSFCNANYWILNPYMGGAAGLRAPGVSANFNKFYYPLSTCNTPNYLSNNTGTGLFRQMNVSGCTAAEVYDPSALNCGVPGPMALRYADSMSLDLGDTLTVLDSLDFPAANSSQMKWTSQKSLFEKLNRDSSLLSDSLFINFYDSIKYTSVGGFAGLEDSIKVLLKEGEENESWVRANDTLVFQLQDSLAYNDSLISAFPDSSFIDSLLEANYLIDSTIALIVSEKDSLALHALTSKSSRIGMLRELSQAIPGDSVYETNLKTVTDIYLATVALGSFTFDDTQQSQLLAIAEMCPVEDIQAVPFARALYFLINDSMVYTDSCIVDTGATCAPPSQPGAVSGYAIGRCGQIGDSYTITPVSGASGYEWYINDTSQARLSGPNGLTGISVDFADSLSAVVLNVVAYNSCGSSPPSQLTILGEPDAVDSIAGATSVCSGGVEYYSTPGSIGATAFNWSLPGDATLLSSNGNAFALVLWGAESGQIGVTASNDCGDAPTYSIDVTVNSCRLSDVSEKDIALVAVPNPTEGLITVKFNSFRESGFRLLVKDLTGRSVAEISGHSKTGLNTYAINLSEFAKGTYFLTLQSDTYNKTIRVILN